jgi:hypothetical protein
MLVIRKEQMDAFSRAEVLKFENWMLSHLEKWFPERCRTLGRGKVQELIQHGITRAATHRIRAKRDVCRFIDLVVVFGPDFEDNEELATVTGPLRGEGSSEERMDAAFAAAVRLLPA